jgi:hypothetical protein
VGAREYDSTTGRFLSADPILDLEDPQQINGYAYANNSPVTRSDPSGLKSLKKVNRGATPHKKKKTKKPQSSGHQKKPKRLNDPAAAGRGGPKPLPDNYDRNRRRHPVPGPISKPGGHGMPVDKEFNTILAYMFGEMDANADTAMSVDEDCTGNYFSRSVCDAGTLAWWAGMVWPGSAWDHKGPIGEYIGLDEDNDDTRYVNVPGTNYRMRYDVWSNIHYGYVGSAAGIGGGTLIAGSHAGVAGRTDAADDFAVQMGIDLWNEYGQDMTEDNLRDYIEDNLDDFHDLEGNSIHGDGNPTGVECRIGLSGC